jgi:hypothetical protein
VTFTYFNIFLISVASEQQFSSRRKREEGRRKKEEGRRKREEGRGNSSKDLNDRECDSLSTAEVS